MRRWKDMISEQWDGTAWNGSIWLRIGTVVGSCKLGNEIFL